MSDWLKISDTMPSEMERVIVCDDRGAVMEGWWLFTDKSRGKIEWLCGEGNYNIINPTHWMPMPKPPEEKGD